MDGRDVMIVWGGLHRRAPTTHLEILDLESFTWRKGECNLPECCLPPLDMNYHNICTLFALPLTLSLSLLLTDTITGEFLGAEPSPRFGHSCVLVPAEDDYSCDAHCSDRNERRNATVAGTVDRLVFAGGSDGNDLVRNGRELRDVSVVCFVVHSTLFIIFNIELILYYITFRSTSFTSSDAPPHHHHPLLPGAHRHSSAAVVVMRTS